MAPTRVSLCMRIRKLDNAPLKILRFLVDRVAVIRPDVLFAPGDLPGDLPRCLRASSGVPLYPFT